MKGTSAVLALVLAIALFQTAPAQINPQGADTTRQSTPAPDQPSRIYYGGTIGASLFGDVFRLSIQPFLGYKITPKFSVGGKLGYDYVKDKRFDPAQTYNNYGASVFTRYRIIPAVYAHAEFAEVNFDYPSGRQWVPFLLVGGGVGQRVGSNTWIYIEVLFDVLQDAKSPYEDWEPWISLGVGVGF